MAASDVLPTADGAATRRALRDLLRGRRGALLVVVGLFAGATVVALAGPLLLGVVVDEVVSGAGDPSVITRVTLALFAVTVLGAGLTHLAEVRAVTVAEGVLATLRGALLTRITALPQAVVERTGTGALLARMIGDVATLSIAARYAAPSATLGVVEVLLTAVALVILSPPLALAALVGVPLGVLSARWYLRRSPQVYRAERERTAELTAELHESFDGAETVTAHRLGPARLAAVRDAGVGAFRAGMRAAAIRNVLRGGVTAGQFVALAALLGTGALLLDAGVVSAGVVTTAAFYVLRLVTPINGLLEVLDRLQTAGAALARIVGVLGLRPALPAAPEAPADGRVAVRLRDVWFGYTARPVLRGVDLDVRVGETLGVVGASGAGKSTIAALVAGVHPADSGRVEVAGEVVLLTQETHTFLGSVADNLRLVAPDADDTRLWAALDTVGARGWVAAMPEGLRTRVGSDGHALPAAAHQQLALARLVLADPAVVVLDEATADFDPAAARDLDRSLAAALAGRTVIAIAHRLHTAEHADRVAVVDDGAIVELGTHDALLAADGDYARLWRRWQEHRAGE